MKTIYIILIMLASFGLIYGQTINLDQTGNGHEVIIHQIGENTVNIEHSGTSQSADIYQEGMLNTANVTQTKKEGYETTPGNNQAVITQVGVENSAIIDQLGAWSNFGGITQYGERNLAVITQGDGDWPTYDNSAIMFQYGDDNESSISQGASENEAEVTQNGHNNKINISMNNSDLNPSENLIIAYQEGMNNSANQDANAPGGYGYIEQIGNNNSIYQNLSATGNIPGAEGIIIQHQNNAAAKQFVTGLHGYGRIYQAALDPDASNYNEQNVNDEGTATANVYGSYNYGSQIQHGRYNGSHIEERGMYNRAETIQNEFSSADIKTSEISSYNNMLINQSIYGGTDHSASIYIDGSYNNAEILQEGIHNSASLHILGDDIETHIVQTGNDMTTSIVQEN